MNEVVEASKEKYRLLLLDELVKKYETSQSFKTNRSSQRRPQLRLANCVLSADYFDEMDYRKRELIHEVLDDLEKKRIIEVTWAKYQKGNQVDKVYLHYEALDDVYRILRRNPKSEQIQFIRDILFPLSNHSWEWVRNWWVKTNSNLSDRKSSGLDLDDFDGQKGLVQVLKALEILQEAIPRRVFSQQVFGHSKVFEQKYESRILAMLRQYGGEEFETAEEYLDSIGIIVNPKLIMVAGSLDIRLGNEIVSLGRFPGGVGLPGPTVEEMRIEKGNFNRIILIENLTSYYQFIADRNVLRNQLIIYTGGFPHNGLRKFFKKISDEYKSHHYILPPIFHWGDMDYGGIMIFEFIRRNFFPGLKPLGMDVITYEHYLHLGMSINEKYAKKLENLKDNSNYLEWRPLLEVMLKNAKTIEQENVEVSI